MKFSPSGCEGILGVNGCLIPLIINADNGRWCAVSIMRRLHYFLRKNSTYSLNGRLGGSQSCCGCSQVQKNLLPLVGIGTWGLVCCGTLLCLVPQHRLTLCSCIVYCHFCGRGIRMWYKRQISV